VASVEEAVYPYSEAAERCVRRKTRTVKIGAVNIGSDHPVACQTMTTTLTHDVEATVAQIKKCSHEGIDIVRITVQGMREAKACEGIRKRLDEDGYTIPIVADIHFTPKVALKCAEFVDKVRVNPGNFIDGRKSFDTISDEADTAALVAESQKQIEKNLTPLVLKLKEYGKALRIGVNHGSMSERILFQYGDTPEGMVASAIEFGDICRKHDFHNFVFSMKSSNPKVMVEAYRSLAREMNRLDEIAIREGTERWNYPLHLGVTEAGGGADGRIKSATGIGALLLDGLGDTVRVSLTEDPELEAAPCVKLANIAKTAALSKGVEPFEEPSGRRDGPVPRRKCDFPLDVPLNSDGSVFCAITADELRSLDEAKMPEMLGLRMRKDGHLQKEPKSVDAVVMDCPIPEHVGEQVRQILNMPQGFVCRPGPHEVEGCTHMVDASDVKDPLPERLGGYAVVFNGEEPLDVMKATLEKTSPRQSCRIR
jgi:(E)-4-hydroxy-3-methylbut-2-enyl-diphosphate synthase